MPRKDMNDHFILPIGNSKTVDVFGVVNIFQVFDYPIYFKNIISIFHTCLLDKHYFIANCFYKCSFPFSTFSVLWKSLASEIRTLSHLLRMPKAQIPRIL